MKFSHRSLLLAIALLVSAGCATTAQVPSSSLVRSDADLAICDRLSFGRTIPSGGEVSEADWAAFLSEVVTPRFPGGFVSWTSEGQWRNPAGSISHERGW